MDSAQLYLVTSCEEPRQAWNAFKNHFVRETLANKLLLKKQYFRSEMKQVTSVDQHLRGCLPKILKPILDYITDFFETSCVHHTLVG